MLLIQLNLNKVATLGVLASGRLTEVERGTIMGTAKRWLWPLSRGLSFHSFLFQDYWLLNRVRQLMEVQINCNIILKMNTLVCKHKRIPERTQPQQQHHIYPLKTKINQVF